LSGTRTTAPAVKVVASATDAPPTTTMAAAMGGASHLANGSLELDLMLMTSSSLQSVTTRHDDAPPYPACFTPEGRTRSTSAQKA
jgi:hypothetical protein